MFAPGNMPAMVEILFALIIAGCTHDEGVCDRLDHDIVTVASRAECEARLDARMLDLTAPYPVYRGACIRDDALAGGQIPTWWRDGASIVALN